MSPSSPAPQRSSAAAPPTVDFAASLQVSTYDRVAALLISFLIILGSAVFMMLVLWLTGRVFVKQSPVAPQLVELPGGGTQFDAAMDWAEPGADVFDELLDPQLEVAIDTISDALSTQLATIDPLGADSSPAAGAAGGEDGISDRVGGDAVVPRWQRWEIQFSANNLESYARQLDFFGIELGAMGGTSQVDYVSDLSKPQPRRRVGNPGDEKRLYMTWRYGPLKDADLQLLSKAGVTTQGRIVVQFIPSGVENELAVIELEYTKKNGRTINQVGKTVFRVVGGAGKYNFEVKEQTERTSS